MPEWLMGRRRTHSSVTRLHYPQPGALSENKCTGWFHPCTKIRGRQAARWGRGNGRKESASTPAAIRKSGYIYRKGSRSKMPKPLGTHVASSFQKTPVGQSLMTRLLCWRVFSGPNLTKERDDQRSCVWQQLCVSG